MPSHRGTILDATALIDFRWLDEWEWLQKHYSPLFIAQELLDSDRLELAPFGLTGVVTVVFPPSIQECFMKTHTFIIRQ